MGRAIATFSGSAMAILPRPFVVVRHFVFTFWQELTGDSERHYRPELHYMRGPGPAWRAKHGEPPAP